MNHAPVDPRVYVLFVLFLVLITCVILAYHIGIERGRQLEQDHPTFQDWLD